MNSQINEDKRRQCADRCDDVGTYQQKLWQKLRPTEPERFRQLRLVEVKSGLFLPSAADVQDVIYPLDHKQNHVILLYARQSTCNLGDIFSRSISRWDSGKLEGERETIKVTCL